PVPPTSGPEPKIADLDPPLLPDPPPVTFPPLPSFTDFRKPGLIPPSSGEPYFPGMASIPVALGSGHPPRRTSPSDSAPDPGRLQLTSDPNVTPVPEPPTIWLATLGAAC